jgi:6-phosphogluconolactonase
LYSQVDWSTWHVFWADERCVPLTSPDSNYRLARKYLFDHVNIPPAQIYALDDSLDPAVAATAYQETLAQVFQPASDLPRFDLILLGMGEDGHTASLFPNHPLLNEIERWVAPIFDSPKPPPERITLTLPVINNARQVIFLTTGAGKAEALSQISKNTDRLPAGMVQPANGDLHWFVDEAAAAGLPA